MPSNPPTSIAGQSSVVYRTASGLSHADNLQPGVDSANPVLPGDYDTKILEAEYLGAVRALVSILGSVLFGFSELSARI